MSLKSTKILGISVTTNTKKEILEFLNNGLKKSGKNGKKTFTIVTPNPEQVVLAHKNAHFENILNRADVAIPDGIGLVWADRILGGKRGVSRISGLEFMEDLVEMAVKQGYRIGLIGGRGGVAVKALECLQKKYPTLAGWTMEPGEIDLSNLSTLSDLIREKIQKTKTRLVFVGLGAPKQEYFIEAVSGLPRKDSGQELSAVSCIFMSVGGSFDEISGRLPRSPKFIDRYGLKWLWRLILEPWRWKRQLALAEFIWLVLSAFFKSRLSLER